MDSHQLFDLVQSLPTETLRGVIQLSAGVISRRHREHLEQLFADRGMKATVSDSSNLVCQTSPDFREGYKKFIAIEFKEGGQTISIRIRYNTLAKERERCYTELWVYPLSVSKRFGIDWIFAETPDDLELSPEVFGETLEAVKKCFKQISELKDELKLL